MNKPLVKSQGFGGRVADWFMTPVMYLLQGTLQEEPQRTHFWNNTKLKKEILQSTLSQAQCVECPGDKNACPPVLWGFIPRFHMPIFGGWRKYVVLDVIDSNTWHVGWMTEHGFVGVSRIPLSGPVRLTIGPKKSYFFAINSNGTVLRLSKIGEGCIGEGGDYKRLPLL